MSNIPTPPAIIRRPSALAAAALEVARTQIGVIEIPKGSNNGPQVREYLASVSLGPGFAWCAAFAFWCFKKAGQNISQANPLPKTGGVMAMFNTAKGKNLVRIDAHDGAISPDAIRPGDIFIMQFAGGLGHTGIVEKVSGDTIITIEGNTDPAGGREGIGVFSKRRKISGLRGIIRVTEIGAF